MLARKGSRLITVGGATFRWTVRRRPTYSQANGWSPLTFVVERAERPGAILVVSLPCAHPGNWLGQGRRSSSRWKIRLALLMVPDAPRLMGGHSDSLIAAAVTVAS
jgi:hypothetical protein